MAMLAQPDALALPPSAVAKSLVACAAAPTAVVRCALAMVISSNPTRPSLLRSRQLPIAVLPLPVASALVPSAVLSKVATLLAPSATPPAEALALVPQASELLPGALAPAPFSPAVARSQTSPAQAGAAISRDSASANGRRRERAGNAGTDCGACMDASPGRVGKPRARNVRACLVFPTAFAGGRASFIFRAGRVPPRRQ